jgi:signal transduction histidine kinase
MIRLVEDLMAVSELESRQLLLGLEPVDIVSFLEPVVAERRLLASQRGVTVELDYEDIPPVLMDRVRVERALNNLLSNAVKSSPEGETVKVVVRRQDDNVVLIVADRGPGLGTATVEPLFQPFVQRPKPAPTGEKGARLGLAIVRWVAEAHHGTVTARDRAGGGAAFVLQMPLAGPR